MSNGTSNAQCQYVSKGSIADWTCPAVFSHATCIQGWDCIPGSGCTQAKAGAGRYNSKEECETNAPDKCAAPMPTGLSVCNAKSSTCEPCTDYCKADSDCAGKGGFCQNGLCHGSLCQQNSTCSATCSADTPEILLGAWRGLQIQAGFGSGEYDLKFQRKSQGPQVMMQGPSGAVSSGSLQSDAAEKGQHLTLDFTTGPLQGTVLNGAYGAWEPSDETEQMAFYFAAPGDAAPAEIGMAMNGTGMTVYVMSKCGHGSVDCDFDSVFASQEVAPMFIDMITDACSTATDCNSCVSNSKAHCFWCPSGNVMYADGTRGTQCAGFDPAGKEKDWVCDKGATQTCPAPPPPPVQQFACKMNSNGPTCTPCKAATKCTSDNDCGSSYCQGGICHGSAPVDCVGQEACNALSKNNCTEPSEKYSICDSWNQQCTPSTKGAPGAVTSYECERTCVGAKIVGTYRAVSISAKFMRGEYDFTFYSDSTMHWKAPDGKTSVAKLVGSGEPYHNTRSVVATITKSEEDNMVGTKLYLLLKTDEAGNDGIAKFMFHGMDTSPITDFGAAMSKREWIMVGCKEGTPCDFSRMSVKA